MHVYMLFITNPKLTFSNITILRTVPTFVSAHTLWITRQVGAIVEIDEINHATKSMQANLSHYDQINLMNLYLN